MRKNSIKNTRINAEVQKELSAIISRRIKDPRIHQMTSVTAVEVAPDLKTCKVYISVLGSDDDLARTLEGLRSAEGWIRKELASGVNLRSTPELKFLPDRSISYAIRMSQMIDDVTRSDRAAHADEEDSSSLEGESADDVNEDGAEDE